MFAKSWSTVGTCESYRSLILNEVVDSDLIERNAKAVLNIFECNLHVQASLLKIITMQYAEILQDHTLEDFGDFKLKD